MILSRFFTRFARCSTTRDERNWFQQVVDDAATSYDATPDWAKPVVVVPPAQKRNRAYMPHCDSSILHSPGSCVACDHYPDWQEYRKVARMNFSNTDDSNCAPCPSLHFRPAETRDRWYGNVPIL